MKPMLAATILDVKALTFPFYASPKIDGIRCIMHNGEGLTRKLKSIPNKYIQQLLIKHYSKLQGYDGELVVGSNFQETSSAVMSFEGKPDFTFNIFDKLGPGCYPTRFYLCRTMPTFVKFVVQQLILDIEQLLKFETGCLTNGYEGVMLRRADGKDEYKFGRSTLNQAYLLKLKRFSDAEAVIVDFEERMHNGNPLEFNNLGYAKRSTKTEGMLPSGTLGAVIVSSPEFGIFSIGSGFNDFQRQTIWNSHHNYIGRILKFKYQRLGVKDKPRFPVFLGFRNPLDMEGD